MNILSGIQIPIMDWTTFWASPLACI